MKIYIEKIYKNNNIKQKFVKAFLKALFKVEKEKM